MDYLSLFSGAGGGDLAMQHLLGFKCKGYVEYEPYCQKLIKQRIEDGFLDSAPIFGDIRDFNREYAECYQGMVDLITGGFPCQDISSAGLGAGICGERSGLWKEYVKAIRIIRPRYAFVENSPMLTIRGLGTVLGDLAEEGFNAEWGVLSAETLGFPHNRERIWIVAYPNGLRLEAYGNDRGGRKIQAVRTSIKTYGNNPELWLQSTASKYHRSNDGFSNRVDRFKAIGNGQVPLVAATAFRILSGGVK